MNILIIDNETRLIPQLVSLLEIHKIFVVKADLLKDDDTKNIDLIILSGGYKFSILKSQDTFYKKEIEIIRTTKIPVIGICAGFELMVVAYGGELVRNENKFVGIYELSIIKNNRIFGDHQSYQVYKSHYWSVKTLSDDFIICATTSTGIDVVKHKTKQQYGLQFHPELERVKTNGYLIFEQILKQIFYPKS
ncbi:MAG: gamma-glutamyl-gamma-aminobutyrate hydrolase family protein [Candidatus Roizmanbacteria bacterium]